VNTLECKNFYEQLGIDSTASSEEVKCAFRRLAKEYHPDTASRPDVGSEQYQKIRTAYEVLIDPDLRKNYNKSLRDSLSQKKTQEIREQLFSIDTATKLEIILAWSTTKPSFNTSFASSLFNRMAEGQELTDIQLDSIDNIIISFKIEVSVWLDNQLRFDAINTLFEKQKLSCETRWP
jgi:DnaJ-class molecular chaperone